jgi:O-antigen/teichoic acid export membrane protein
MEKEDSYSHIIKYTSIFGGVQGVNILVSIIRNKLVALLLGPDGMGLVSLFNSTIKLISDSTNFGLAMSAVKNISETYQSGDWVQLRSSIKLVRSWSVLTALLGLIVCIALSPLLNNWTFNWGNHTLHFIFLSPIVALTAVTGGELAILKGTRHLKYLAAISIYNVLCGLVISVPLYYFWHEEAIVPSLILVSLAQMLVTIIYSFHLFPLRLSMNQLFLGKGINMMKLGIAFILSGMLGSGADFVIRSYMSHSTTLSNVGLFNAGYMITMVYSGMIFSAMETDYFPRLSAVQHNGEKLSLVVNRQIEVSVLLISPMLVFFTIGLPVILPLFLSRKFLPALPMSQILVLAMYLRAAKLPVAYIPLAKGDSFSYLLMEGTYDIVVTVLVILLFSYYGLNGVGWGFLFTAVFDFFLLNIYMGIKYNYRLYRTTLSFFILQSGIGILAFISSAFLHGALYWIIGGTCLAISILLSWHFLSHYTDVSFRILNFIKRKNHG